VESPVIFKECGQFGKGAYSEEQMLSHKWHWVKTAKSTSVRCWIKLC